MSDLITAGALLAGGAWGYFRFVRGRIFAPRAEIAVAAAPVREPLSGLRVQIAVKNTGASRVDLDAKLRFIETFGITESDWPVDTNVDWGNPVILTRVLALHDWVESSETVNEDVLVPLPPVDRHGMPFVAFLVRARLSAATTRRNRPPTGWAAQVIVLSEHVESSERVEARIPD